MQWPRLPHHSYEPSNQVHPFFLRVVPRQLQALSEAAAIAAGTAEARRKKEIQDKLQQRIAADEMLRQNAIAEANAAQQALAMQALLRKGAWSVPITSH